MVKNGLCYINFSFFKQKIIGVLGRANLFHYRKLMLFFFHLDLFNPLVYLTDQAINK
jgi:hypothetical protein